MAVSPLGLCTSSSLYLEHSFHFSSTLTGPSKHNSGGVPSRKPSLTGPKPGSSTFQNLWVWGTTESHQGPTQNSKAHWFCGLTLQQAFPKAILVLVSLPTPAPRWPSAHHRSRPGAKGGANGPWEDVPTLPREETVCRRISQGPLRPTALPLPQDGNHGAVSQDPS